LNVGDKAVEMKLRFTPSAAFGESVCETKIARGVQVAGLPHLNDHPKRIVVFGDTGCRIKITKKKAQIQACNDPKEWSFAEIARAAAAWKPDLVIHVGDYNYRESDCPLGHKECEGSVAGDNLTSWQQDFFTPAAPLLAAAPWIFIRGNHETCDRAGAGWSHFLDVAPYETCQFGADPRAVSLGEREFLIVDSAEDTNIALSLRHAKKPAKHTWLLTHRPLMTAGAENADDKTVSLPKGWNDLLSVLLVGHVHTISLNVFKDSRPPEFILGSGGSALAEIKQTDAQKAEAVETQWHDYGFTTFEDLGGGKWDLRVHDRHGADVIRCEWNEFERGLKCAK
jgi:predicted phosphodiesterase